MKVVNLTLFFSRKYRLPEHYFMVGMVLRNFSEITNSKPIFRQYNIFYNYEYQSISIINLRFDLFSIIPKEVNQIRNNVVCVVARFVFMFCCALTMGHCNAFQHIFVNYNKSEFYGPYFQNVISCDYDLIMNSNEDYNNADLLQ